MARWEDFFSNAFTNTYDTTQRIASRQEELAQEMKQKQMYYDLNMSSKGYQPLNDGEMREFLRSLQSKQMGFAASEGYIGIPKGSTAKDGYIYDKENNVIGEYLDGFEPQQSLVRLQMNDADIVNLGGRFYRFNPEYAKRFGAGDLGTGLKELQDTIMGAGLQGTITPSTVRIGNKTYRYNPSAEEKGTNPIMPQAVAPQAAAETSAIPEYDPATQKLQKRTVNGKVEYRVINK